LGLRLATGTVSPPFFRLHLASVAKKGLPRLAPPIGKAGRYSQTGFMQYSLNCHCRKQWVAKDKISIYIVKVNFSKIVDFKGMIRKFLIMVAVYIKGPWHSHICLFETLFSCQCPFNTLAVHIEGIRPLPICLLDTLFRVSVPLTGLIFQVFFVRTSTHTGASVC
jgi:hypothetical protein